MWTMSTALEENLGNGCRQTKRGVQERDLGWSNIQKLQNEEKTVNEKHIRALEVEGEKECYFRYQKKGFRKEVVINCVKCCLQVENISKGGHQSLVTVAEEC